MNDNQLYANGRIAVLSNKLLGADKFSRIAESVTVVEALKVLSESGYGGGLVVENANDYERVLMSELDSAMKLLEELCFDKKANKYFLCRYLYHNAKVLMKRKYMRISGTDGCFEFAGINPEQMQRAFVADDYSFCTKNMAEACDRIDSAFADGNRSPQVVDMHLDKAMFADMREFAKKSSISLVRQLFDWEVDTINLMLCHRLKKAAFAKESLDEWFVEGASVKKQTISALWDDEKATHLLPDKYKDFFALCTMENATLAAAEAEQKSQRNQLIKLNSDYLTIQPVIEYFFAKVDEIDKVRFALIGIKNGVDKDVIKERLK